MSERKSICAPEEKPERTGRHQIRKPLQAGEKFNRLTVLSFFGMIGKTQEAAWNCRCDCGALLVVRGTHLWNGHSKSCGCLKLETTIARNTTHGLARIPEHVIWNAIIARCENPNDRSYPRYGGRGIGICKAWRHDFAAFIAYVGRKPFVGATMDRINSNGNYEPGNVRWATSKQQNRNRRDNRILTCNGQSKCLSEWAEEFGIKPQSISARLARGWSDEAAVLTPIKKWTSH